MQLSRYYRAGVRASAPFPTAIETPPTPPVYDRQLGSRASLQAQHNNNKKSAKLQTLFHTGLGGEGGVTGLFMLSRESMYLEIIQKMI